MKALQNSDSAAMNLFFIRSCVLAVATVVAGGGYFFHATSTATAAATVLELNPSFASDAVHGGRQPSMQAGEGSHDPLANSTKRQSRLVPGFVVWSLAKSLSMRIVVTHAAAREQSALAPLSVVAVSWVTVRLQI